VIPAGLPHGPIATKRIYSPKGFGFWAVELNPATEITWLGEAASNLSSEQRKSAPEGLNFAEADKVLRNKPTQATGKYARLVKSLRSYLLMERGKINPARFTPEQLAQREEMSRKTGEKPGPGGTEHIIWMSGKDLDGLHANIFWGFCSQPHLAPRSGIPCPSDG